MAAEIIPMFRSSGTIGIIGYGRFGAFLHELATRFAPEREVRVFNPGPDQSRPESAPIQVVAASDIVVLAVPIRKYEIVLEMTVPWLSEDSVVVDVASVKAYSEDLFRRHLPNHPYLCTHPLFGPESFGRRDAEFDGFRVVVTSHNLGQHRFEAVRRKLREFNVGIVEMTADRHDRYLAETLFLTHAVSQVIIDAGFKRLPIDTVSFGLLMDAVDCVRNDGDLFDDVCRFNPYCRDVAQRLLSGYALLTDRLNRLVEEDPET